MMFQSTLKQLWGPGKAIYKAPCLIFNPQMSKWDFFNPLPSFPWGFSDLKIEALKPPPPFRGFSDLKIEALKQSWKIKLSV